MDRAVAAHRVPADGWLDWQNRNRISRRAGDRAFANEAMTEMSRVELII